MHANFHILCFSSANMAFSLTFAQTAQAFLSLSLALASSSRAFYAIFLTSFAISRVVISLLLASRRALWNLDILSRVKCAISFPRGQVELSSQTKKGHLGPTL